MAAERPLFQRSVDGFGFDGRKGRRAKDASVPTSSLRIIPTRPAHRVTLWRAQYLGTDLTQTKSFLMDRFWRKAAAHAPGCYSLLSITRLNMVRSRARPSIWSVVQIDQTCLGRSGGFARSACPCSKATAYEASG